MAKDKQYESIGVCPTDELTCDTTSGDYNGKRIQCNRWRDMLINTFMNDKTLECQHTENNEFRTVKIKLTDIIPLDYEVVITYLDEDEASCEFVDYVLNNLPAFWNNESGDISDDMWCAEEEKE